MKDKNHTIISIDAEKALDKIQYPFIIKTLKKPGYRRNIPPQIKGMYNRPTAGIILNEEKMQACPVR